MPAIVQVQGRQVVLSRTEFQILEYLVQREDFVVKFDELLNFVYGPRDLWNRRSLGIILSRLRKKVGRKPNGEKYIHTILRLGYVLRDRNRDIVVRAAEITLIAA